VISIAGLRLRKLHLVATALASVIVFSVFFMGSVTAYVGHSSYIVSLTRTSVRSCSDSGSITATVRDAKTKKPVKFQTVVWSLGSAKSSKDKVSPSSSTTNGSGQARTSVRFGDKAGTRTVYASVKGFKSRTTASCSQAGKPTPKPTKKPTKTPRATQPHKTPAPTPKRTNKPTNKPAQATPAPTPKPTKKPHRDTPTPAPTATPTAVPTTLPAGGITPSPIGEASPSPSDSLTGVVDPNSTGDPAATANTAPLPASDASQPGGGGGFDLGLIALLVIGALGALVVIFLIRQPTRARR